MDYSQALKIISKKQSLGIKPGLSRIENLMSVMGNPQNKIKVIHVAGTNGKGMVSATLADALCKQGFKTGLFTSPWITDYTEQIQLNGENISKKTLSSYIEKYCEYDCTEFELLTAIMYKYFYDEKVDYAVVECGMGGREDSTNVVTSPVLSVITKVSVDHTDFLGNSLAEIASHKAGIIKKGCKAVIYPNEECSDFFENYCEKVGAEFVSVSEHGNFKENNLAVVNACLSELKFENVQSCVLLPARQEYLTPDIMIDGAHNLNGALGLRNYIPKNRKITAVIGMMKDKNFDGYLENIAPLCNRIIATTPSNPRALEAKELASYANKYCADVTFIDSPLSAVDAAINDYDFLLVCGSFYLARDVRNYLKNNLF